ncbi:MAG: alpha/beta hydrolase [Deltaproteobacteria bacterium]|nr:alpha/beta hydrolase [Deltaproteobacteria bacterium]
MDTDISFVNHLGERLFGTHHRPDAPSGYGVVLGHCFTCTRHTGILREAGARLTAAGFHVLRFDFSGNGQSEGVFIETSYSKYIIEMEIAADFLKTYGVKWLGFAGHSMGAAVSVLAGARLSGIQAICAIAGRLTGMDPSRIFSRDQRRQFEETGRLEFVSRGRHLELDRRFLSDMLSHDMRAAVASLRIPLLIVQGSRDEIVPEDQARQARSINPDYSELVVISGADHFFSQAEHRDSAALKIARWFSRIRETTR